jgi:hypothetical protein
MDNRVLLCPTFRKDLNLTLAQNHTLEEQRTLERGNMGKEKKKEKKGNLHIDILSLSLTQQTSLPKSRYFQQDTVCL